ncbi:phage holin [Paraliobacillus ryukyuensis]|uniref:phage holin n=1 Tax=Paraliobacillus ryukyuensis TaxID=200904 RepID=UPI0009A566D2|nr:phage holin [Paraliobacillus ryukyuensis]
MKNFDKGTLIRTLALVLALANQIFAIFGVEQLPIDEDQINTFVELGYQLFSVAATSVAALIAWFENNYITKKGKAQKEALQKEGLTK